MLLYFFAESNDLYICVLTKVFIIDSQIIDELNILSNLKIHQFLGYVEQYMVCWFFLLKKDIIQLPKYCLCTGFNPYNMYLK